MNWFQETLKRKSLALNQPVFVIKLHDIEHARWPEVLRNFPGYDFIGDRELGLPKGFVANEEPKGQDYHEAARRVATEVLRHLKALKEREVAERRIEQPKPAPSKPTLYLAAVPEECARLRRDLVARLADRFDIIPLENPRNPLDVRNRAKDWARSSDLFAEVVGASAGVWPDNEPSPGYVVFQHRVVEDLGLPIRSFLSPKAERQAIDDEEHLALFDSIHSPETLESFIQTIVDVRSRPARPQSIFIVADNDKTLERSVRKTMAKLDILAYPFEIDIQELRELNKLNEKALTRELCSSKAVFVLQGKVKDDDLLWGVGQHRFLVTKLRQIGKRPKVAIIDGPPPPRCRENVDAEQEPIVFLNDNLEFETRVAAWLASVPDVVESRHA